MSTDLIVPEFAPGIYETMTNADYHAIEALSASGIKTLLQSPMHYRFERDNPREDTASMAMGSALHMAILEPDLYESNVIVIPDEAPARPTSRQLLAKKPSPATVEAIAWWADFDAKAQGKIMLTEEQSKKVDGMAGSVQRHPFIKTMLCDGRAELSLLWRDARLGIPCRCRFDYLRHDGIAIDLKSTVDASPLGFMRAVTTWKYHLQEAHYRNGYEHLFNESLRAFIFVAVENVAPYGCAAYVLESNAVRFGIDRVEEAMLLYEQATKTGYWRGYTEKIMPLQLPRYALQVAPINY